MSWSFSRRNQRRTKGVRIISTWNRHRCVPCQEGSVSHYNLQLHWRSCTFFLEDPSNSHAHKPRVTKTYPCIPIPVVYLMVQSVDPTQSDHTWSRSSLPSPPTTESGCTPITINLSESTSNGTQRTRFVIRHY